MKHTLSLAQVLEQNPDLSNAGYAGAENHTDPCISDKSEVFEEVCAFIEQNFVPTKTANVSAHYAKDQVQKKINKYVSRGVFIAAAIATGLTIRKSTPYATFVGITEKSMKAVAA